MKFQSIQETEFNGSENDADRYIASEKEETHINEYGVRVRGAKKPDNYDEGDELVVFSINR